METQDKYFYYTWRDKPKQSQLCNKENKLHVKALCQFSDSLFPGQHSSMEIKNIAQWQLKRKNSIVERNSQTQMNSTRIRTRRNSVATGYESSHKTPRKSSIQHNESQISAQQTVKQRFKEDNIDEQSRKRLSRFFASREICNLIHKRSLSRQDNPIYAEDIDKDIVNAQIKSIQNQQIRFQFRQSNSNLQSLIKSEMQVNDTINIKQSTFKSVYQQIQHLTNEQRKKKVPITNHKLLKSKTKLLQCKPKIQEKLQNIMKQVLFVVKYQCKTTLWFEFPIKYNHQFYESIINGDYETILNFLQDKPYLIHSRNRDGQTPLHISCICNNVSLTKMFIKNSADIEALDSKQLSPLFYAFRANANACFKCLLQNNARPWSSPGGKLDQHQMNVVQKNLLMHARLIYIFTIWQIKK